MAAVFLCNAVSVCLLVLFAVGTVAQFNQAELDAVQETVRRITLKNPLWNSLPTENGCKDNTMNFLLGCLEPILPAVDAKLGVALNEIAQIETTETESTVVLKGDTILKTLDKDITMVKACCVPVCELAKWGCGCNDIVFQNLKTLVGGDEPTALNVMDRLAEECLADNPDMSFKPTLKGRVECAATFEEEARAFIC